MKGEKRNIKITIFMIIYKDFIKSVKQKNSPELLKILGYLQLKQKERTKVLCHFGYIIVLVFV